MFGSRRARGSFSILARFREAGETRRLLKIPRVFGLKSPQTDMPARYRDFRRRGMNGLGQDAAHEDLKPRHILGGCPRSDRIPMASTPQVASRIHSALRKTISVHLSRRGAGGRLDLCRLPRINRPRKPGPDVPAYASDARRHRDAGHVAGPPRERRRSAIASLARLLRTVRGP